MVGWGGHGSARFRCDRHTSAYGRLGRPGFGDDSAVGLRGYPEGFVPEDGAGPVGWSAVGSTRWYQERLTERLQKPRDVLCLRDDGQEPHSSVTLRTLENVHLEGAAQ